MNGLLNRRRATAAVAAATLLLGGIGAGGAAAQTTMSTPPPITGHAQLGSGLGLGLGLGSGSSATPGGGLPGMGLFKALFAVFGAVRTAVPTIAAPIIAQAVTAGTITQAQADQLTALVAGHHPTPTMGTTTTPPAKPSAAELTVLHSVITAVLGQLGTIAAPVLAAEVTAGDITQAESDMIAKIITGLASIKAPASMATGLAAGAASGTLAASLESKVTAKVKTHVKAKHARAKHAAKAHRTTH